MAVEFGLIPEHKGWVFVKAPYGMVDSVRAIPGREWDKKKKKHWAFPLDSMDFALRMFPQADISPALVTELQEYTARKQEAISAKSADVSIDVRGLKATLYPYQQQGVAFLRTIQQGEGRVLAFDMGLGKSLTSLAYFLDLYNRGLVKYLMVVCPSPLKYATWEDEVKKWTDLDCMVVDGDYVEEVVNPKTGKVKRRRGMEVEEDDGTIKRYTGKQLREVQYLQYLNGVPIVIVNYELFLHDGDKLDPNNKNKVLEKGLMPKLNGDWMVVLDEAHRIKNPTATTTKTLVHHIKDAGYKVLGTGTPLENNIEELWQLVDLCKEGLLGSNWAFKNRYVEKDFYPVERFNGQAIKERLPELKQKIDPVMFRKTKADALPDLPELTIVDRWVDMTKVQRDLYEEVKAGILERGDGDVQYLEVLPQITRFQQICDSPSLLNEVLERTDLPEESGKLAELPLILSEIRPEENKVILFTQYETMARLLVKKLREWYPQYGTETVTGKVTDDQKRAQAVRNFQNDPRTKFIVITTAGNYGLNLQAATYVIAFDETFNPQKMEQVYSRAHRNGQKNAVTAINLKTRDTYEERKTKLLSSKRAIFANVIDGVEEQDEDLMKRLGTAKDLLALV